MDTELRETADANRWHRIGSKTEEKTEPTCGELGEANWSKRVSSFRTGTLELLDHGTVTRSTGLDQIVAWLPICFKMDSRGSGTVMTGHQQPSTFFITGLLA